MFRQLDVNGSVSGTGVNIIIGSGGFGGGNGGQINMTAGTGGGMSAMNGVLIFDLEGIGASTTPDVRYAGTFASNFDGAIYFPYAHLTFRGGSNLTGCMVVVAKILDFSGNSSMDMSGCRNDDLLSLAYVVMLTN
jgi:hypothetical protein